jgi:hypothetical protein
MGIHADAPAERHDELQRRFIEKFSQMALAATFTTRKITVWMMSPLFIRRCLMGFDFAAHSFRLHQIRRCIGYPFHVLDERLTVLAFFLRIVLIDETIGQFAAAVSRTWRSS